jgi:DNA-binding XRE family transcriptional regulator
VYRTDIHDEHNDNILPLVYTLEIEINLLDFNPKYPKNPHNLGQQIRKARMDRSMTLKKTAALFGVTDTTILNWEIRSKMPDKDRLERVNEFIKNCSVH